MNFETIVTLGPSLTSDKLKKIDALGKCIYRVNGAHTTPEQLPTVIENVRSVLPNSRIMVDLPGNKVRTANLTTPVMLEKGEVFEFHREQFNYQDFYKHLSVGDILRANDSIYKLEVVGIEGTTIKLKSHSNGPLQNNKGVLKKGLGKDLPFLFERDLNLIKAAALHKANIISLSFVRHKDDVLDVKRVFEENGFNDLEIFAKIETASAVENLDSILDHVEVANVDRGDLSSDIGFLPLLEAQEKVIKISKDRGKRIFLATQFLKNMETHPVPLIAEVLDLAKTLKSGISGIQLSEETAVGKYPVECVEFVFQTLKENS